MNRKYRQRGYQEKDEAVGRPAAKRPVHHREGPRSPRMPGLKKVVKCVSCGAGLPASMEEIEFSTTCPSCGADLHSCRNCVFLDPSKRFECAQPVGQRVSPKDRRADCEFFEIRSSVEKIISSSGPASPIDARDAFENLFRK